jgi:hypothetical protein
VTLGAAGGLVPGGKSRSGAAAIAGSPDRLVCRLRSSRPGVQLGRLWVALACQRARVAVGQERVRAVRRSRAVLMYVKQFVASLVDTLHLAYIVRTIVA